MTESHYLKDDEVHIWKYSLASLKLPSLIEKAPLFLNSDELKRAEKIAVETSRQEYLVGRLCLRFLLSQYNNSILPSEWPLTENSYGKPEISTNRPDLNLNFNLSHSGGELVFIISKNLMVGIDIEHIKYQESLIGVAKKSFSDREYRHLLTLSGHHQAAKFYELWTLKEAYIKARGIGLTMPLDTFSFDYPNMKSSEVPTSPKIVFEAGSDNSDKLWKFFLFLPCNGFQIAAAIGYAGDIDVKLADKGNVNLIF